MMIKKIILLACFFLTFTVSAQSLDTQFSEDGLEVHVLKATIAHNILTVVLAFENTTDQDITSLSIPLGVVAFNTNSQNYPVLKDSNKQWLASTVAYSNSKNHIFVNRKQSSKYFSFTVKAGKKKVGWMKFEAPREQDWPLSLNLPAVTPFSISKPQ